MHAPSVPPRVFGFVGTLVVVTLFSAFNLNHRSSVSFGFQTIEDVPIFITCLTSFTLGAAIMVPLALRRRAPADARDPEEPQQDEAPTAQSERLPADEPGLSESPGNDPEPIESLTPSEPRRAWWRPWGARRGDRNA